MTTAGIGSSDPVHPINCSITLGYAGVTVHVDDSRPDLTGRAQRKLEKRFSGNAVALRREQKIDSIAGRVNDPI
jgi:hypothetical protein